MSTIDESTPESGIGYKLLHNKSAKFGEIFAVFAIPLTVYAVAFPFVRDDVMASQGVVWVANILMILTVWTGLRLRGQTMQHFGFSLKVADRKTMKRTVLWSIPVLVFAVFGFVLGSIIMANIVGIPEPADMSQYNPLQGNLPLLLLTLAGVYISASFGEEFVYRGFLITRLEEMVSKGPATAIALAISSVIFGLIHFAWGPMGMVQTGFMGLALGISYIKLGRNLWITILAHGYMDTILMVQMYFGQAAQVE